MAQGEAWPVPVRWRPVRPHWGPPSAKEVTLPKLLRFVGRRCLLGAGLDLSPFLPIPGAGAEAAVKKWGLGRRTQEVPLWWVVPKG